MRRITDNVYVETGFRVCNTGIVITRQGVVIIDTPMVPDEAKKWRDEAVKHGPIRYVINTESHTDHASGNCWFGAPVLAHEGTYQALTSAKTEDLVNALKIMAPDGLPLDPNFHYQLPEITFLQNMTLHLGDHTLHLINMPGHTASETAVYIPEERAVFTGDNLNLRMPFFVKSVPYLWLESLKRLQQLDVDRVVPGHGDISDKSCIQPAADAVQYWIKVVKAAVDRGLTLEQTMETVTMAEKYPNAEDPRNKGIIRNNVVDLYQYLKTQNK
jgi:cyclase